MNVTAQQSEFLGWKIVPARLDATQAAWFLGFEPQEIPMLVAAGLAIRAQQHEVLCCGGTGTIPPRRELNNTRSLLMCLSRPTSVFLALRYKVVKWFNE